MCCLLIIGSEFFKDLRNISFCDLSRYCFLLDASLEFRIFFSKRVR